MTSPAAPIRESTLSVNLNDEAHSLVRELAMACRKMSIYGSGHPLAGKAVEKPFLILEYIFRYKSYINLNVLKGQLHLLNIRLKDSPFNGQILQFLQLLDVNAALFERSVTVQDFTFFIESLVRREMHYDPGFSLATYLNEYGVDCIQVNSEMAFALFENRRQYRGDVAGDFTVRRLALDQLGDDPIRLARLRNANAPTLLEYGIDFDPAIIRYLLPEKAAGLSATRLHQLLTELADQIKTGELGPQRTQQATYDYMALFQLVETHPERDRIVANLDDQRAGDQVSGAEPLTGTGTIKIETSARIDQLVETVFTSSSPDYQCDDFADTFLRLLKTGQQPKANDVIGRLIEYMGVAEPGLRQKALNLLAAAMVQLRQVGDTEVLGGVVDQTVEQIQAKVETYEYSEFLWLLFDTCHAHRLHQQMARLTQAMAARRTITDNVTIYDSMAVKKGFENISRPATVGRLVEEITRANQERARHLKEIMAAIGTEEIALGLSNIISHPLRNVRQLVLKILAELGKSSLKVFSEIIFDDTMFERPEDRFELPDEQWYVVRNSIFVLGSLRDPQGVSPLRARISDPDVRVRREIVSALEKIGGEEAVDCLTLMSEDPVKEIREAAIITIGLIGSADTAPLLIDIARRNPLESIKAVTALGKVGGDDARRFLGRLLEQPDELAHLAAGKISRDDLRIAIVKALGQIGDQDAIAQVRKFRDSQSAASKLLFKSSPVNKAISDVLARR